MTEFAQAIIDVLTWFVQPIAYIIVIYWVISLFRKD